VKKKINPALDVLIRDMWDTTRLLIKVRNSVKKVELSKQLSPETIAALNKRVKMAFSLITTSLEEIKNRS